MPEVRYRTCKSCKKDMGQMGSKSPLCKECREKLANNEFTKGLESTKVTGVN